MSDRTKTVVSKGVLGGKSVPKYLFDNAEQATKFLIEQGYRITDSNLAYHDDFDEWARIDSVLIKEDA